MHIIIIIVIFVAAILVTDNILIVPALTMQCLLLKNITYIYVREGGGYEDMRK
jgi:hypothetical protein